LPVTFKRRLTSPKSKKRARTGFSKEGGRGGVILKRKTEVPLVGKRGRGSKTPSDKQGRGKGFL